MTEPLEDPPASNRKRPKKRPPPASAVRRGQGRRVDLEQHEAAGGEDAGPAGTGAGPRPKTARRTESPAGAGGGRTGGRKV